MTNRRRLTIYRRKTISKFGDLDTQEEKCREYASRNGWDVVSVYTDEESSLEVSPLPAMQALLDEVDERNFDGIIVYDIRNFARTDAEEKLIFNILRTFGIQSITTVVGPTEEWWDARHEGRGYDHLRE